MSRIPSSFFRLHRQAIRLSQQEAHQVGEVASSDAVEGTGVDQVDTTTGEGRAAPLITIFEP
jgi:hypothetical protein